MQETILEQIDASLHAGVEACEDCVTACEMAVNAAIDEGGRYTFIRACRDAADLAALAARFMARHAALTPELCEVVAKACEACEAECGHVASDYAYACADACRRCREECDSIAA